MPFHPTLCDIDAVGDNSSAVCICLLKQHIANLPQEAFAKIDNSDDGLFYATSRFVKHIDDVALQAFYLCAETLTADGIVFDLMSSWVSHLPQSFTGSVVGHGMNAEELSANLSLRSYLLQNLNLMPKLQFPAVIFDAALRCDGVQYLV